MTAHHCSVCRKLLFSYEVERHRCPPKWRVKIPEWLGEEDGDALDVYAIDAEAAAEEAVERRDEMQELAQAEESVRVLVLENGKWTAYRVRGYYSLSYTAEVDDE